MFAPRTVDGKGIAEQTTETPRSQPAGFAGR